MYSVCFTILLDSFWGVLNLTGTSGTCSVFLNYWCCSSTAAVWSAVTVNHCEHLKKSVPLRGSELQKSVSDPPANDALSCERWPPPALSPPSSSSVPNECQRGPQSASRPPTTNTNTMIAGTAAATTIGTWSCYLKPVSHVGSSVFTEGCRCYECGLWKLE